eukprot:1181536-Prorocentrum_minimum.AAC.2
MERVKAEAQAGIKRLFEAHETETASLRKEIENAIAQSSRRDARSTGDAISAKSICAAPRVSKYFIAEDICFRKFRKEYVRLWNSLKHTGQHRWTWH